MKLTAGGTDLEGWRMLPRIYAACLVAMAVIFFLFTTNRRPEGDARTMRRMLKENGPPPAGRFEDFRFLEPVRDFKARHASTLLTFDAVVDCLDQIERKRAAATADGAAE